MDKVGFKLSMACWELQGLLKPPQSTAFSGLFYFNTYQVAWNHFSNKQGKEVFPRTPAELPLITALPTTPPVILAVLHPLLGCFRLPTLGWAQVTVVTLEDLDLQ